MSYTAIGSGSSTLNAMSAEEQKNPQEALKKRYDRTRQAQVAEWREEKADRLEER